MTPTQSMLDYSTYRMLFHALANPLLLVDARTTAVRDANAAACRAFGLPRKQLLSLTLDELAARQDAPSSASWTVTKLTGGDLPLNLVQFADAGPVGANADDIPREVGRAKAFQEVVIRLAGSEAFTQGNLQETYRLITEAAAAIMEVERVGVWLLDETQERLTCVDQYDAGSGSHTAGIILEADSNPAYFAAIRSGRVIDAAQARTDPRTAAFTTDYLVPYDIFSLLDAGVLVDGHIAGIICCEQTGCVRQWATHDLALAGALADQLAAVLLQARNRATETALLASEKRYVNLIANASDIIYTRDLDGNFTSINPAGERLLGYSSAEFTRLNLRDLIAPDQRPAAEQFIQRSQSRQNTSSPTEIEVITKAGRRRILEVTAHLGMNDSHTPEIQAIARDITERRELEKQLLQSQKMDALGKLAGGVAHDFNNLLAVILSYSEMALLQLDAADKTARYVRRIQEAGDRAAELTQQLLAFSRSERLDQHTVHVNEGVTHLEKMLGRILGENITLQIHLDSSHDDRVDMDPSQLDQVIMNLVVNARDAMPEGGTITVSTRTVTLDQPSADLDLKPGRFLQLSVEDTGHGINDQTLAHIFEPFYTTKPPGKGTGLGLSTVYGIVKQSGGAIRVQRQRKMGSRFDIFLPLSASPEPVSSPPAVQDPPLSSQALAILVVEDETTVCQLTREALETHGHHVLATTDQLQAIEWCHTYEGTIDVLLTDVIMPNMSGPQLAEQVRLCRPAIKVVYLSGYTGDYLDMARDKTGQTANLISKPFTPDSLVTQLEEIVARMPADEETQPGMT